MCLKDTVTVFLIVGAIALSSSSADATESPAAISETLRRFSEDNTYADESPKGTQKAVHVAVRRSWPAWRTDIARAFPAGISVGCTRRASFRRG
jgi:hypothetical protein